MLRENGVKGGARASPVKKGAHDPGNASEPSRAGCTTLLPEPGFLSTTRDSFLFRALHRF